MRCVLVITITATLSYSLLLTIYIGLLYHQLYAVYYSHLATLKYVCF